MRVLVFAHHLELGGSQVNAIDLAAAARDRHGHEVTMIAAGGPAAELARAKHIRLLAAPTASIHPSPAVGMALVRAIRETRADLVHAWDWPQCVDAAAAVGVTGGPPVLGSDMSMTVNRRNPQHVPLTYGTPALAEAARRMRSGPVYLLEPPVDIEAHDPGAFDPSAFNSEHLAQRASCTFVIVSRLIAWMKLDGIRRAMAAVGSLARRESVRLLIVGGGPALPQLRAQALSTNQAAQQEVIVLTGPMADPRPAYAAADVVLGMGSSALRGMAFAKPVIVLGEAGFSAVFTPATSAAFLQRGFFGSGGPDALAGQMLALASNPTARSALGWYARQIVEERFALGAVADRLAGIYEITAAAPNRLRAAVEVPATVALQLAAEAGARIRRSSPAAFGFATAGGLPPTR